MTRNRCELSAMIAEISKMAESTNAKPSVINKNFIFCSSFIFVSVKLALKSKVVKCYQKWLNNEVKSAFYCPFLMTNIF